MDKWNNKINSLTIINTTSMLILLCIPYLDLEKLNLVVDAYAHNQSLAVSIVAKMMIEELLILFIVVNVYAMILSLTLIDVEKNILLLSVVTSRIIMAIMNNFIPSDLFMNYPIISILRDFIFGIVVLFMIYAYCSEKRYYNILKHKFTLGLMLASNIFVSILQIYLFNE